MTMPYVYDKPEADKLANAKAQGQAQFDSIREMVEALENARKILAVIEDDGGKTNAAEKIVDEAERAIHEDALTVEVRSGWYVPAGEALDALQKPEEYRILLCTGGPAVQIVGKLSEHGEPETAVMQVQDWFLPWTDYRPWFNANEPECDVDAILLAYARCFYFGE